MKVENLVVTTPRDRGFTLGPLSFTVERGAPLAVLGAAGAGKSLLLWTLASRTPGAAMVFQRDALDDARTALENVAVAATHDKAVAALTRVGLAADMHKRPREMSGGMKKRVGIARALAVEPEVLIADDPTAGLDPETAREVLELLVAPIVVVSTQDVDVVVPRVKQVLVLDHGRVTFLGEPAGLTGTPFAVAA